MTLFRTLLVATAAGALTACDRDSMTEPLPDFERAALQGQPLVQMDRFGIPAVATVFIPTAQKDAYNQAAPAGDPAAFQQFVVSVLTSFGHPDPNGLADALMPDIQPIDVTQPSGFLNGRRLQDDVITAELGLIFGGNAALNDDHVDANDRPFLPGFPYLAGPHL